MNKKHLILIMVFCLLFDTTKFLAQWIPQNGGTNARLIDVIMLDSTSAIIVGRNRAILKTTNSGKSWTDVSAPLSFTEPWNCVSFSDKDNGVVAGDHGSVLTTKNGGINWIWHSIPANEKCLSALYIGPGNIYVGTDSGSVYHSVDSGKTWVSQKISKWPIRSLFAWRGTYTMGLPIYALTSFSLCSKTEFPFSPWSEKILAQFQGLGSEAFDGEFCNGGGSGFIVGVQGDLISTPVLLRKSFSDTTWQYIPTGIIGIGMLLGVSAPSYNVIYVCGDNGLIIKSTNGGDTWKAIYSPISKNINAIYFYDEKHGFAVGDEGTILFTSNGVLTGIDDRKNQLPVKFLLSQNYPNPFNPSTVISWQLAVGSLVTLKVYDLLGREVATLVDEFQQAGTHNSQFSTLPASRQVRNPAVAGQLTSGISAKSGYASGVYFYTLRAGGYVETKKMILMK